jgi:hypothetical protein
LHWQKIPGSYQPREFKREVANILASITFWVRACSAKLIKADEQRLLVLASPCLPLP